MYCISYVVLSIPCQFWKLSVQFPLGYLAVQCNKLNVHDNNIGNGLGQLIIMGNSIRF